MVSYEANVQFGGFFLKKKKKKTTLTGTVSLIALNYIKRYIKRHSKLDCIKLH